MSEKVLSHGAVTISYAEMRNIGINSAIIFHHIKGIMFAANQSDAEKIEWIPIKMEDIQLQTGLSLHIIRNAKKQLKKLGWIETGLLGLPPIEYYKVNWKAWMDWRGGNGGW